MARSLRTLISHPWRGVGELPGEIWMLAGTNFVNRVGTMARAFLILYLVSHFHVSAIKAGLVLTLYGAAAIIAAPLAGTVCDRVGPLPVMQGALLCGGAVVATLPFLPTYQSVLVIAMVWALVAEAFRPASLMLLNNATDPARRRLAMSVNRLAINLGTSVGPAVGGILASISFIALFLSDAATSIIAAIVLGVWIRARGLARSHGKISAHGSASPVGIWTVLRNTKVLSLFIASLLVTTVFMQVESTWPLHLVHDLGFPPSKYGLLLTINGILIVVLEIPLTRATASWPHRTVLAIACTLVGAGFGAMALAQSVIAIVGTVVLWTLGEMLLFTTMSAAFSELAPADGMGAYMGVFSLSISASTLTAPWLGTTIYQWWGSTAVWVTCFILSLVTAGIILGVMTGTSGFTPNRT